MGVVRVVGVGLIVLLAGCRSGASQIDPAVLDSGRFMGSCMSTNCQRVVWTKNSEDREAWRFDARPTAGQRAGQAGLALLNPFWFIRAPIAMSDTTWAKVWVSGSQQACEEARQSFRLRVEVRDTSCEGPFYFKEIGWEEPKTTNFGK